jgi:hypothetical protein
MNNDNFDDIIKQKADNHQAPFPSDAWDNIAKKKKKRLVPVFWFSLSSLLIAGTIVTYIYSNKIYNHSIAINNNEQVTSKLQNKEDVNINVSVVKGNNLVNKDAQSFGTMAQSDLSEKNDSISNVNNKNNNVSDQKREVYDNSLTTKKKDQPNKILSPTNLSRRGLKNNVKDNNSALVMDKSDSHDKNQVQKELNVRNKKVNANIVYSKEFSVHKWSGPTATINGVGKHVYVQKAKYRATIIGARESDDDLNNTVSINKITNDNTADQNKKSNSFSDTTAIEIKQRPLAIDSLLKTKKKNTDSLKTTDQNKITAATIKKTKRPLFIDISIIPFASIQQYGQPSSVIRVTNNSTIHSTYTANAVQTSLQPAVALAFSLRKNISKKLTIGLGVQFSQIKENIKMSGEEIDTNYTPIKRLATNNGSPYLANDTVATVATGNRTINALNSYSVFSIPLFVTYTFYNRKSFSVGGTGGVCLNIAQYHNAINGRLQSVYPNGIQNNGSNLTVDILMGIHFAWNFNKKYQLFAEPNFRYSLDKYQLGNTFLSKNIDQAGLSLGISYKIK